MSKRDGFLGKLGSARARKHLRSDSDDYDDVLLPFNGKVSAARAFLSAPELKFCDTYLLATDCGEAANLSDGLISQYSGPTSGRPLFLPVRGDAYDHRTGTIVHVRSWHLKLSLQVLPIDNGTRIPQGISVFVALIHDSQTNGALCSAANVFSNASGDQNLLMCLQRNPLFGKRFDVIRSEIVDMTPNMFEVLDILTPDQTASMGVWKHLEFFMPLDLVVNFAENSGQIQDVIDHSFHVYAVRTPHNGSGAENYPPVRAVFTSRFRFTDAPM